MGRHSTTFIPREVKKYENLLRRVPFQKHYLRLTMCKVQDLLGPVRFSNTLGKTGID